MPTYVYICENCGHEMEAFQSMKDDPLKGCPECNKETLKRKIGAGAGIIFKGSGFYCTDYRSDTYESAKKKDIGSADSSSKSSDSKEKATKKEKSTSKAE